MYSARNSSNNVELVCKVSVHTNLTESRTNRFFQGIDEVKLRKRLERLNTKNILRENKFKGKENRSSDPIQ